MRKKSGILVVFFALALFVAGNVLAVPLDPEKNITIYDNEKSGTTGWYNRGASPGEDEEVEPGNESGQRWDLEGFFLYGDKLTMVGGFDFINGVGGYKSDDIFIDVDGDARYGTEAFSADGLTADGVQPLSHLYGYDYVIDLHLSDRTYDAYSLNEDAVLESVYFRSNDGANPWRYASGGTKLNNDAYSFNYASYSELAGFAGSGHNALTVDLGILGDVLDNGFLAHFTIECGNDNLMGASAPVPEPATMLLLGVGLISLAGVGRKKFKKDGLDGPDAPTQGS